MPDPMECPNCGSDAIHEFAERDERTGDLLYTYWTCDDCGEGWLPEDGDEEEE